MKEGSTRIPKNKRKKKRNAAIKKIKQRNDSIPKKEL